MFNQDVVIMTEIKGDANTGKDRPVKVSLDQKKKTIHIYFQAARLRKIDLSAQDEEVMMVKVIKQPILICKFSIGYDLALQMDSEDVYQAVSYSLHSCVLFWLLRYHHTI